MTKILENFSLKDFNTFHISATARRYATFSTIEELTELIRFCSEGAIRHLVLGRGANILFSSDFDGMVIRSAMTAIRPSEEGRVIVDGGVEWDDFVGWSVEHGLGGLENLSYIPGSVGAAPIQNIGAYGAEAKDTIEWVEFLDIDTLQIKRLSNSQCRFGYRESIFKQELKGRVVITRVAFRLRENVEKFNIEYGDVASEVEKLGGPSLANIRKAITDIRRSKLPEPSELGNAGSFFKNPVVTREKFEELRERFEDLRWFEVEGGGRKIPAGWMIEKAGWKGRREGNVGVHTKQALVLVNYGGATGGDVLAFASRVQQAVDEKFGIWIDMEVNVVFLRE